MRSGDMLADRFVIEQLAGSGGMGEVYRAMDCETGEPVAIKVLQGQGSDDIVRFDREARILSELDDPRVVRHIAHGTAPSGDPFLVMEWLDGEDLARRLHRGTLGLGESILLCTAVADTLGMLHDKGIVHRDLKPSNIFLVHRRTDQIKILDFGIAQIAGFSRMTGTGMLVGTLGYMAPEQANGTKNLDARTDVFALGCVLFECIAGEPAFSGAHPMAFLTKILFEETPRLSYRCAGVPVELDALVGQLLSKNREARPPHGRAVADALRALGSMPSRALAETIAVSISHLPVLTDSEQRALAVILVSASVETSSQLDQDRIETIASEHGATVEWLLDGSLALLVSGTGVATDLAAQAARCALAVGAHAAGRRVVLGIGRGHGTGKLPLGPAIDQAVRLLGGKAPESGVIAIDDAAVGLLDARFDVRDESGVYVLAGERDVTEVRSLLGKPTPCVGRERELRALEGMFEDATGEEPRAHAALVIAPPGMGKSRLSREFLQKVRSRGEPVSIWIARGEPLRAGAPFALASQLVQSAASIRGGEPLEVRQEKLRAYVGKHVAEARRRQVIEFLGEMIGAPFSDKDSLPLRAARGDAQLMNDQVCTAFMDFLSAECASKAVLLVLEDLHWGDSPTVEVLGRALRDMTKSPLFVLALARPEVHEMFPKLWAVRSMQEIRMLELSNKAAERLVRHVLGDRVPVQTVQKIVELSAGNAFYLEELIRATAEGHGDNLPETVVAMVQSRLGTLSDIERRLLRAASIYGEIFWAGAVAALLGDANTLTRKVEESLRALVEKELFVKRAESHFPSESEYAFRHALVREGAYSLLTDEDRALGHRLAGEWLERMGENDPVVLAEHFEKGGDGAKAGVQWALAAEQASRGNDAERGIHYAHRGLACTAPGETRNRLLGTLCILHYNHIDTLDRARPHAEELLHASEPGSTPWAQATAVTLFLAARDRAADTLALTLKATLTTEMKPEASDAAAILLASASAFLAQSGHIAQATAMYRKLEWVAKAAAEAYPTTTIIYHVYSGVRCAYADQNPWAGLEHARAAIRLNLTIGHKAYGLLAKLYEALNWWYLGANAAAKSSLLELHAFQGPGAASSVRPFVLAWLLAESGSFTEAREYAAEFIARSQTRSIPLDEARGRWVLAEVLRRCGELDSAETEIQIALSILRNVCPIDLPGALATQALLFLARGRPDDALAAAVEGMAKMEAMGACSIFFRNAFLRLAHAESLKACGRHDDATVAITKAREWLIEVAAKIGEDEYKRSFIENVPENRRIVELARQWDASDKLVCE